MTISILTVDASFTTRPQVQASHANSQIVCGDTSMIPVTDI